MLLSKANLVTVKVAGTDKRDQVLHQMRVEPDGSTVASDGQAMLVVEPVSERPEAMPDFDDETDVGDGGAGFSPAVVNDALRNIPKGALGLELGFVAVTGLDEEDGKVELTATDLNKNLKVEGPLARRRFPEWEGVLRRAKRACSHKVCVDRRALIRLLQAMESACPNPDHSVFIEFGEEETDGFLLRSVGVETGQHAVGYMVPLDTGGEWLKMNAWERKALGRTIKRRRRGEEEA